MLNIPSQLARIVGEAVRQQSETGYPQAIILSGSVGLYLFIIFLNILQKLKNYNLKIGSGKTHCSMLLLRQLFAVAGNFFFEKFT